MRREAVREPLTLREAGAINLPAGADRIQSLALIVGGAGVLVTLAALAFDPRYFFRAWLVGWVY
jgi:hypothetical protein